MIDSQISHKIHARFGVPYHHRKLDAVLQWEACIATEVLQNLSKIYKKGWRSLWEHPQAPHGSHCVILPEIHSQIAYNIPHLGYPTSMGSRTRCCKETNPLLLDCFVSFLRWIGSVGWVSGSIYKPLVVHAVYFLSRSTLKLYVKLQDLGEPHYLSTQERNDMLQGKVAIAAEILHTPI